MELNLKMLKALEVSNTALRFPCENEHHSINNTLLLHSKENIKVSITVDSLSCVLWNLNLIYFSSKNIVYPLGENG